MTNTKRTKRALLSSVVALLLCFSMLIGTTYAWFTDSVTSASNVIKTGNLDIEVEYTLDGETWNDLDGAGDLFQKGLWEPGHTEVVALKIENKGSLALKYVANMNIYNEIVGKNKDGGDIVLSEILTVGTLVQEANQVGEIAVELAFKNENMYKGTAAFKASNVLEENQELLPGSAHYVIIKVDMAETVGNEANHDGVNVPSIEFGLNVLATQYTYENDSFGNQYDKDAAYDKLWNGSFDTAWYYADPAATEFTIESANELAGLAQLVNTGVDSFAGKSFKLSDNVDLNGIKWTPIGTKANSFKGVFDGQGNTVKNLYIESDASSVGLFGFVEGNVSISNLTVENAVIVDKVTGDDSAAYGAVIGNATSATPVKVDNVTVTGNIQINGDWYVGALIGRSKGAVVTNCSVIGEDGSFISSGRWAAAISGYDNGEAKISDCRIENIEVKSASYSGGVAALGAAGADVHGNTVKNVDIVVENASASLTKAYGSVIGGVSVYSYSKKPITAYDNTVDGVTYTVNGVAADAQEMGSKYASGEDQGLVTMPTVKLGNDHYTYLKLAVAAAPKDETTTIIELTGDTMITAKFKPSVAKDQNIILKTNGYNLIWVEQDGNKMPVTDADGNLVTIVVTDANMSSYITVKTGGSFTIQ